MYRIVLILNTNNTYLHQIFLKLNIKLNIIGT